MNLKVYAYNSVLNYSRVFNVNTSCGYKSSVEKQGLICFPLALSSGGECEQQKNVLINQT